MSGTQQNDFLSMQKDWREPLTSGLTNPYNKERSVRQIQIRSSAGGAFSVFGSSLFFKLSAVAAPLRRSCSPLCVFHSVIILVALLAVACGTQPADNIYIADVNNHRIRKVDSAGVITTVAGTGTAGSLGDGGAAVGAQLNGPVGVAVDGAGNLYIADHLNNRIRKVDSAGVISTVAGNGTEGYSGDGGAAVGAQLYSPRGLALDGADNLYIVDNGNNRIRKVDSAGVISTVAGNGTEGYSGDGGAAVGAQLYYPNGVALDGSGNLYIAEWNNHRIRKVDSAGVITTVAGNGTEGYSGDGGAAVGAQLYYPNGVALDGSGNLYIADFGNHRIRKVDSAGVITTVAGNGTEGYSGDGGAAVGAQLNGPVGVAVDGAGNLYIADTFNNRIRKVDSAGVISTVAGNGADGYSGDGGAAVGAQLNAPYGLALD